MGQFAEAVSEFEQFLAGQGRGLPLTWVMPSDVAIWKGQVFIRARPEALMESEELFLTAKAEGHGVSLNAHETASGGICCWVIMATSAEDAANRWVKPPLTMKRRVSSRKAKRIDWFAWTLIRLVSTRRNRQLSMQFLGID